MRNPASYSPVKAVSKAWAVWLILTCLFTAGIRGQNDPLQRKIEITFRNVLLSQALESIADKGRFEFSYRSDLIDSELRVTADFSRGVRVSEILEAILPGGLMFERVGNHVIVKRGDRVENDKRSIRLDCLLVDAGSGDPIRFATVYENYKRSSQLTDPAGKCGFEFPAEAFPLELFVKRAGYKERLLLFDGGGQKRIELEPIPGYGQGVEPRTVDLLTGHEPLPFERVFVPKKQRRLALNLPFSLREFPVQISLLPFISTNKLISGAMENNLSINIIAGYSQGVRGAEFGGLFNFDRQNVIGLQAGGLGNMVGGDVTGVQTAGVVNFVKGNMRGMQSGGVYNRSESMRGVQLGGVMNRTGSAVGFQAAGLINEVNGPVNGMQIAGLANRSDSLHGMQLSGFLNYAGHVRGMQLGLINIADTVDGVSFGLVNVVEKGYAVVELGFTDLLYTTVAYKGGSHKMYNTFAFGLHVAEGQVFWAYGGGFGLNRPLFGSRLRFNAEAMAWQLHEPGTRSDRLNLWTPLRLNLGYQALEGMEIFAGGSMNFRAVNASPAQSGNFATLLEPKTIWSYADTKTMLGIWPGFQGGVRFQLW